MKLIKSTLASLLVVSISTNFTFANGINFRHLSLTDGLEKAKSEGKLLFIDIYATWCGPCKMLSNSTFKDEDLGNYMNDNFVSIKLDGEKEDGAILMSDFQLDAFPTMLFLSPDRELIRKLVGFVDAETVQSEADKARHPENSLLFKLNKRFENGERAKYFLQELILEALEEEQDLTGYAETYLSLFPDLDLENTAEFIVFASGSDAIDDPHVQKFLKDAKTYKEIHDGLADWKIRMIIINIVQEAVEKNDKDNVEEKVHSIYPAYKMIYGEEAFGEKELTAAILQAIEED